MFRDKRMMTLGCGWHPPYAGELTLLEKDIFYSNGKLFIFPDIERLSWDIYTLFFYTLFFTLYFYTYIYTLFTLFSFLYVNLKNKLILENRVKKFF